MMSIMSLSCRLEDEQVMADKHAICEELVKKLLAFEALDPLE
jgi:hypothetical protein